MLSAFVYTNSLNAFYVIKKCVQLFSGAFAQPICESKQRYRKKIDFSRRNILDTKGRPILFLEIAEM